VRRFNGRQPTLLCKRRVISGFSSNIEPNIAITSINRDGNGQWLSRSSSNFIESNKPKTNCWYESDKQFKIKIKKFERRLKYNTTTDST
jgi:hypothetical protein